MIQGKGQMKPDIGVKGNCLAFFVLFFRFSEKRCENQRFSRLTNQNIIGMETNDFFNLR